MKVINYGGKLRPLSAMKDGDIAEIIRWGRFDENIGRLVQRYQDSAIILGKPYGESFSQIFKNDVCNDVSKYAVKILKKGTTIEL